MNFLTDQRSIDVAIMKKIIDLDIIQHGIVMNIADVAIDQNLDQILDQDLNLDMSKINIMNIPEPPSTCTNMISVYRNHEHLWSCSTIMKFSKVVDDMIIDIFRNIDFLNRLRTHPISYKWEVRMHLILPLKNSKYLFPGGEGPESIWEALQDVRQLITDNGNIIYDLANDNDFVTPPVTPRVTPARVDASQQAYCQACSHWENTLQILYHLNCKLCSEPIPADTYYYLCELCGTQLPQLANYLQMPLNFRQ